MLKKVLIALILIACFLRIYRIDYPNAYVFDEVYHSFTAKEYLKANKSAWDPWATPPSGVAFEWTHPPLAKEIMTSSMFWLHTTDAWAWRIPGVLLGFLSIFLVYLLGRDLFNKEVGLLSAFIFSIDGLNFVQSRTGMNDIYIVSGMLFSLWLFIKNRFFISAILLGLAISSKWTGIYLYGVILISLIYFKKIPKIIYFLLIPPLIYLASYLPYFLLGYDWNNFVELQKQMWGYHTGLKATHDYASAWWSWPLNLVPVWYYVQYYESSMSNIFASGNLLVFLFGLVAIIVSSFQVLKDLVKNFRFPRFLTYFRTHLNKDTEKLTIILLGFFAFLIPWALSPRIAFLYHYSPSVPFLSLVLGYQLNNLNQQKEYKTVFYVILGLMFISFLLVYPFLTGLPLPKDIIQFFFDTNIAKKPFQMRQSLFVPNEGKASLSQMRQSLFVLQMKRSANYLSC